MEYIEEFTVFTALLFIVSLSLREWQRSRQLYAKWQPTGHGFDAKDLVARVEVARRSDQFVTWSRRHSTSRHAARLACSRRAVSEFSYFRSRGNPDTGQPERDSD